MDKPIDSRRFAATLGKSFAVSPHPVQRLGLGHFSLHTMGLDACNSPLAKLLGYADKQQCRDLFSPGAHKLLSLFDAVKIKLRNAGNTRFSQELLLQRIDGAEIPARVSIS